MVRHNSFGHFALFKLIDTTVKVIGSFITLPFNILLKGFKKYLMVCHNILGHFTLFKLIGSFITLPFNILFSVMSCTADAPSNTVPLKIIGNYEQKPQVNCLNGFETANKTRHFKVYCNSDGEWEGLQPCFRK